MQKKTRLMIIVGVVVLALAVFAGVGFAVGGDDDETEAPITGAALEQASAAALEQTGGGEVTDTEVGDEESYYEVEVTRPDGTQVDVQLDEDFNVVGTEDEGAEEDDEGADDEGSDA